jgi:hypothetical protein
VVAAAGGTNVWSTTMRDSVEIAQRFRGPPGSGNGGYVAGVLAERLARVDEPITVRLLRPPPLDVRLEVRPTADGGVNLVHGEDVLVCAAPGTLDLEAPEPPAFVTAVEISRSFPGLERHPFPGCFVCGPAREHGDGLRILPGAWCDDVVAAPWVPDATLDRGDGRVRREHVWAALDCPGYFAVAPHGRPMLLGQITAQLGRALRIGEPSVVVGWSVATQRRKHRAGTAVFGADGEPCGLAEAVWIEPRASSAPGMDVPAATARPSPS